MGMPMDERARRQFVVTVEYDHRGARQTKTFATMQKAKAFYVRMFNSNRNPRIVPNQ